MKTFLSLSHFLPLAFFCTVAYSQEFEAQSGSMRINFNTKDTSAPEVFMTYKNEGRINTRGKVDVEIRVFDPSGIKHVAINGVSKLKGNPIDSIKFLMEFYNDEEILVVAEDYFGLVKERPFIIRGQSPLASGQKVERRFYALLLAVENYADPAYETLTEPINDATLLKDVLKRKYSFEDADITLIKNPTAQNIENAFEDLRLKVTGEDLLLIFYAGHGWFDEKTQIGYWYPSDASKANKATWFRNSALVENIGAINSKHTLLIADACFSGGIFKTRSANNASGEISNLMRKASRKAMTSGTLTTVPDKSVFMKYLLKTLEENENKYLPCEDLYDAVRMGMKNNTDIKPAYGELKNMGDEGGNFVFTQRN